jgi:AraC-like DNA-binding protein
MGYEKRHSPPMRLKGLPALLGRGDQPGYPLPLALSGAAQQIQSARLDLVRVWWWRMPPTWIMHRRVIGNGLLYAPIDREVIVEVGEVSFPVIPGQVAVLPEGIPHAARYRHRPRGTFDLACFHLRLIDRHGQDVLRRFPRRALPLPGGAAGWPDLRRVAEHWSGGGDDGLAATAIGLRALLLDIALAAGGWEASGPFDPRIARCLDALTADTQGRLRMADLSALAGMGERRLRTVFHAAIGVGPKAYQIRLRMGEAMRLLADPQVTVKAIADRLGFASDHEFHAAFRREVGCTPTRWRLLADAPHAQSMIRGGD